jgi:hypothetical protein
VCKSPEDVKRYLNYRFRVKKGFPVREPKGEEKAKLEARAAAAAAAAQEAAKGNDADTPSKCSGAVGPMKYQIELSFFKLRALGAAVRGQGQRKRQSIEAAEQQWNKATELAQPQSNAENPTTVKKELQQKDRVMENLLQSHNEFARADPIPERRPRKSS